MEDHIFRGKGTPGWTFLKVITLRQENAGYGFQIDQLDINRLPGRICSQVPPGAWVIQHPEDDPDHVQVIAYEIDNPGSIISVGEFEVDTGLFVRVIIEY